MVGQGLDGAPHVLLAPLRSRPDGEPGTRAGRGSRRPVPHAAHVRPRDTTSARRCLRLRDLLRVRGRRRPDLPRGVRGASRRQAQSRVGVRARRALLARAARGDVGRVVHVSAAVLALTDAPGADAIAAIEGGLSRYNRQQARLLGLAGARRPRLRRGHPGRLITGFTRRPLAAGDPAC